MPAVRPVRRNLPMAALLAGVVAGMTGLSFAAVPLYRMFCEATGYGGTPQIGPSVSPGVVARPIVVRFNADTHPGLPWRFTPLESEARLQLGEERLAFYTATNRAETAVTGVATYNVTPEKAAKYFHKTACFCFDQQTLGPRQDMQFPLSFYVDPAIATDPSTADVRTITLSYTFFRSLDDAARSGALAEAGPHVGRLLE
ncbi:MAG: cytochrome c oxidase assembly protein [Rhodospirillales bacterium 70-18]|nr:cytochrome c oxidase assembly protein [Rhodospirillales bacterium]OJY70455.1 MAG: cytochrome c oxidase assembly protein [Rhodospirillales bacterium 70-18]